MELDEFAVSYKPQKISPKFPGTVGTSAAMLHCLPGCNSPEHCTQQPALALAITAGIHPLHSPLSAPAHWRRALPRALQVRELLHKRIRDSYLHPGFQADVMKPLTIEHLMDNEVQTLSGGEFCCVEKKLQNAGHWCWWARLESQHAVLCIVMRLQPTSCLLLD